MCSGRGFGGEKLEFFFMEIKTAYKKGKKTARLYTMGQGERKQVNRPGELTVRKQRKRSGNC